MIPAGKIIILTDIVLCNTSEVDIEFTPSAKVVIGINEVKKGEHGNSESTEHAATLEAAGHRVITYNFQQNKFSFCNFD